MFLFSFLTFVLLFHCVASAPESSQVGLFLLLFVGCFLILFFRFCFQPQLTKTSDDLGNALRFQSIKRQVALVCFLLFQHRPGWFFTTFLLFIFQDAEAALRASAIQNELFTESAAQRTASQHRLDPAKDTLEQASESERHLAESQMEAEEIASAGARGTRNSRFGIEAPAWGTWQFWSRRTQRLQGRKWLAETQRSPVARPRKSVAWGHHLQWSAGLSSKSWSRCKEKRRWEREVFGLSIFSCFQCFFWAVFVAFLSSEALDSDINIQIQKAKMKKTFSYFFSLLAVFLCLYFVSTLLYVFLSVVYDGLSDSSVSLTRCSANWSARRVASPPKTYSASQRRGKDKSVRSLFHSSSSLSPLCFPLVFSFSYFQGFSSPVLFIVLFRCAARREWARRVKAVSCTARQGTRAVATRPRRQTEARVHSRIIQKWVERETNVVQTEAQENRAVMLMKRVERREE